VEQLERQAFKAGIDFAIVPVVAEEMHDPQERLEQPAFQAAIEFRVDSPREEPDEPEQPEGDLSDDMEMVDTQEEGRPPLRGERSPRLPGRGPSSRRGRGTGGPGGGRVVYRRDGDSIAAWMMPSLAASWLRSCVSTSRRSCTGEGCERRQGRCGKPGAACGF
jgi:hypothetical protein